MQGGKEYPLVILRRGEYVVVGVVLLEDSFQLARGLVREVFGVAQPRRSLGIEAEFRGGG